MVSDGGEDGGSRVGDIDVSLWLLVVLDDVGEGAGWIVGVSGIFLVRWDSRCGCASFSVRTSAHIEQV